MANDGDPTSRWAAAGGRERPIVTILTYGTRGDVEPFIALAHRLIRAGVRVRLTAPELYSELLQAPEAAFFGLPGDPRALAGSLTDRAGASAPRMIGVLARHVGQIALQAMRVIEDACRGADCIVHSFLMTASGHQQALARGIPEVSVQLFPVFSTTGDFAGPTFPDLPLGSSYRRVSHVLNAQIYWQGSRLLYGWLRRQHGGLPPLPGYPFARGTRPGVPILYAFSPAVIPRPRNWPPDSIVTGYWFKESHPGWQPSEDLVRFLQAGEPPVYIGLGSMVGRDWGRLMRQCVELLSDAGLRGVVAAGSDFGAASDWTSDVCVVGDVPHAWLFPRVAAVLHHGGAGTTAAALRAGKPSLILPLTADQGFWARRVQRLGAAGPALRKRYLQDDLRQGLRLLRENPALRQQAEALAEQITREDGTGRAVEEILRRMAAHA